VYIHLKWCQESASEFRYRNPVVDSDTLYVAISQSGRDVVLCCGISTRELLRGCGSGLWSRVRSRLDMMVCLRNLALRRPILGLEYGWPTIAPTAGGVVLVSRYGGAQPPVEGFAAGRSRLVRPASWSMSCLVCCDPAWSRSSAAAARGCAARPGTRPGSRTGGVEPNYAAMISGVIHDHPHREAVLGGQWLAVHADREQRLGVGAGGVHHQCRWGCRRSSEYGGRGGEPAYRVLPHED
jgi:hypothetical protein